MSDETDLDRSNARLADPARRLVLADERRIVIVGARGWIGRTAIDLLREALGPDRFAQRVFCFGSADGEIAMGADAAVPQRALERLSDLDARPTLLLHLAFLTKDKVAGMDPAHYEAANRALSRTVHDALDRIGVDRLFVASSGAAAFADDPAAADDLRLYGRLKRDDEELFTRWATASPAVRRLLVGRIYSLSGPWINKYETYALASFILDALAGRSIEVRAPLPVLRSYVAVRELLSFILTALIEERGETVLHFETGGQPLELGEVAGTVARLLGGDVVRAALTRDGENRYVGDNAGWQALLHRFGLSHLPLEGQIMETASWLAKEVGTDLSMTLAAKTSRC